MGLQRIAVIGGGLMGAGIAHSFAVAGHAVTVFEPDAAMRGSLGERIAESLRAVGDAADAVTRVVATATLEEAVGDADYVTEAAPERLELKRAIFADLVAHAPHRAILASNTSVIPIGRIAHGLDTSSRIVGTHWWNPATLIPLVEVIQGAQTSDATIAATMDLLRSIGKTPAHVRKDIPGFVANRLQHALWREAIALVAEGVCDVETLDACVKNSFGRRLAVLGPLENADLVGLDLTLDIHRTIMPELDSRGGPNPYLVEQVEAGRLGFKSGEGFRRWSPDQIADVRTRLVNHLLGARDEEHKSRLPPIK